LANTGIGADLRDDVVAVKVDSLTPSIALTPLAGNRMR
jgi:hypothetical protein